MNRIRLIEIDLFWQTTFCFIWTRHKEVKYRSTTVDIHLIWYLFDFITEKNEQ